MDHSEYEIEPKSIFLTKISKYYHGLASSEISTSLLNKIIQAVTQNIYDDYGGFCKKYPKFRERYSSLKIKDLEHPFIYFIIFNILEKVEPTKTMQYSKILFKMDEKDFERFLKFKNWYHTK